VSSASEACGYGSAPFNVLNIECRRRVIEEAARNNVDLIFTFVWDLRDPADSAYVEQLVAPFEEAGGEVCVLELTADLETRLLRNRGETRLAAKPSKRKMEWSDGNVRSMEAHQMNTDPTGSTPTPADGFLSRNRHLRLDTRNLTAAEVPRSHLTGLTKKQTNSVADDLLTLPRFRACTQTIC